MITNRRVYLSALRGEWIIRSEGRLAWAYTMEWVPLAVVERTNPQQTLVCYDTPEQRVCEVDRSARVAVGTVEVCVVDRGPHAFDQPVAQRLHTDTVGRQVLDRHLRGGRHGDRARDIGCAGANVALLATAVQQRGTAGVTPQ